MQKSEKVILKFALIGTLVAFGMASISYILGAINESKSESASMQVPVEVNDTQPMSMSDAPVFVIDAAQSEVRFSLGELLGGEPVTVVGVTDAVSGTISLSTDAPQDAQVGEIAGSARGLATDNDFRNRAIHSVILNTSAYEYIRFVPTSISGLPDAVSLGETVEFEITGTLTIKDISHEVTFSAKVTPVSDTQLDGHAETMIAYVDYDILIPSAPRVAEVDDEILLEIDFVALLAE